MCDYQNILSIFEAPRACLLLESSMCSLLPLSLLLFLLSFLRSFQCWGPSSRVSYTLTHTLAPRHISSFQHLLGPSKTGFFLTFSHFAFLIYDSENTWFFFLGGGVHCRDGMVTCSTSSSNSRPSTGQMEIPCFKGLMILFPKRPWVPFFTHPCQHFLGYIAGGNVN